MGFLDKLKETFTADDKPKSFEVTFVEKMGMTLAAGPQGEPLVTGGRCVFCSNIKFVGVVISNFQLVIF